MLLLRPALSTLGSSVLLPSLLDGIVTPVFCPGEFIGIISLCPRMQGISPIVEVPLDIFLCAERQCLGFGGLADAMDGTVLLRRLMGEGGEQ